jgi:hypothetical protein
VPREIEVASLIGKQMISRHSSVQTPSWRYCAPEKDLLLVLKIEGLEIKRSILAQG